jgi:hypothetical protein
MARTGPAQTSRSARAARAGKAGRAARPPATSGTSAAALTAEHAAGLPWLRAPWWDLGGLAFCWLPFYGFVVFWLGLDGRWSAGGRGGGGQEPGLGLAMLVALAISYVHRHYTFLLVYGDAETLLRRRRAYVVLPAISFVGLAMIVRGQQDWRIPLPGVADGASPWLIVLTIHRPVERVAHRDAAPRDHADLCG